MADAIGGFLIFENELLADYGLMRKINLLVQEGCFLTTELSSIVRNNYTEKLVISL